MARVLFLTAIWLVVTVLSQGQADAACPEDWHHYEKGNKCYKTFSTHVTHGDAREACKGLGGDLATIRDADQQKFIEGLIDLNPMDFHIGLTDNEQEGVFKWLDEDKETTYTNWYFGQPDNAWGDENCATIWGYFASYQRKWVDQACDTSEPYICEKPAA